MTNDNDRWELELMQTMLRHGKTIWDAIEFACALVPEAMITREQSDEILSYVAKKGRNPIAIALGKLLEMQRDERSNVEQS